MTTAGPNFFEMTPFFKIMTPQLWIAVSTSDGDSHTATDPHRNMRARWSDFRFRQFGHFGQFGQFGHFANCPNCLNCPKLELAGGLELENRDCTRADNDVMSAIAPDRFG